MAIRNLRELATRFRQDAADCEESASRHILPDGRARLLKMAEYYWALADKIDPKPKREPVAKAPMLRRGAA
jgi:hypothetical protein